MYALLINSMLVYKHYLVFAIIFDQLLPLKYIIKSSIMYRPMFNLSEFPNNLFLIRMANLFSVKKVVCMYIAYIDSFTSALIPDSHKRYIHVPLNFLYSFVALFVGSSQTYSI